MQDGDACTGHAECFYPVVTVPPKVCLFVKAKGSCRNRAVRNYYRGRSTFRGGGVPRSELLGLTLC